MQERELRLAGDPGLANDRGARSVDPPANRSPGRVGMMVRIESGSRWDALALTRKLARYHWFLVEPDLEHWDIYVALDDGEGCDRLPDGLRQPLLDWLDERQLERTTVHARETDFVLTRR